MILPGSFKTDVWSHCKELAEIEVSSKLKIDHVKVKIPLCTIFSAKVTWALICWNIFRKKTLPAFCKIFGP